MRRWLGAVALLLCTSLLPAQILGVARRSVYIPLTGITPTWDATSSTSCNPSFTTPASTFSCTLTGVAAGSLLVIGYFVTSNNAISSVTVDGTAATLVINQALAGSFGYQGVYYVANATAGTHTVLLTFATSITPPALYVSSLLGAPASSPLDGTPNGAVFTVGTGVAFSCPSSTTTQTNELSVAWGMTSGATNITSGAGYTLRPGVALNSGNSGGAFESKTAGPIGTYTPGFTNGAGGHQGCIGFVVKHS